MTTFTSEQISKLSEPLNKAHVKKNPKGFDYVEGWHAIAEANRIFGFDGWTREMSSLVQVEPAYQVGDKWRVAYRATVRITVGSIVRDGTGYGSGIGKDLNDAHESAVKEAETDAMKRALMTFGNPFGLALYDKEQANVAEAPPPPKPRPSAAIDGAKVSIDMCGDEGALNAWVKDNTQSLRRMQSEHPDAYAEVMEHAKLRKEFLRASVASSDFGDISAAGAHLNGKAAA